MTIVVVASGPSLTKEDVDYCRGRAEVLCVNDCYRLAPWAEYMYAADWDWWTSIPLDSGQPNYAMSKRVFLGERFTCDVQAAKVHKLKLVEHSIDPEPGKVWGGNSGHEAVVLAQLFGARRIVLLGFDMGETGLGHWFGRHPILRKSLPDGTWYSENLDRSTEANFSDWRDDMKRLAAVLKGAGIEAFNCTRTTALKCFPRRTLQEVLT